MTNRNLIGTLIVAVAAAFALGWWTRDYTSVERDSSQKAIEGKSSLGSSSEVQMPREIIPTRVKIATGAEENELNDENESISTSLPEATEVNTTDSRPSHAPSPFVVSDDRWSLDEPFVEYYGFSTFQKDVVNRAVDETWDEFLRVQDQYSKVVSQDNEEMVILIDAFSKQAMPLREKLLVQLNNVVEDDERRNALMKAFDGIFRSFGKDERKVILSYKNGQYKCSESKPDTTAGGGQLTVGGDELPLLYRQLWHK